MAKQNNQNITTTNTNTFIKGLNKDSNTTFVQEGMWVHARNAVNNTVEGDLGTISNEASNILCVSVLENVSVSPLAIKKIIGAIHLFADKWVIFSSVNDQVNTGLSLYSEIGLFEEDECTYRVIAEQDTCLNFNMYHLITGASRLQEDCSWGVYFSDGNNPDRYINIGDPKDWPTDSYNGNNYYGPDNILWPAIEWEEDCVINQDDLECPDPNQGCKECTQQNTLDCDKIRLARVFKTPCLKLSVAEEGGQLANGTYFVVAAYSIKQQKVTDWFSPSNIQPLFYEEQPNGALKIEVDVEQDMFDEFVLALVSVINQQTTAYEIGYYNTNTSTIIIDILDPRLKAIPLRELPLQHPVYEKSNQILEVNNYLLRVGPTSKFDFNYQPLANLIQTNWVSVEYDADYYVKQGYKPSYMRDEVYSFFIRWVYDTGDKSSSYHIPGRSPEIITIPCTGATKLECETIVNNHNVIQLTGEKVFEVFNTATVTDTTVSTLEDGGKVIAKGKMGYWESSEIYPADQREIWNSSSQCWTGTTDSEYNLCGKYIRHHKFPEQGTGLQVHHYFNDNGDMKIRLLGVQFDNIILPKDNDGNDVPGIVGYEILRGSRAGNKSIIAKGMLNNMRPYNNIQSSNTGVIQKSLYPNYPFNTIIPKDPANDTAEGTLNPSGQANDPYIINVELENSGGVFNPLKLKERNVQLTDIPKNIVSFHSPDTNFITPRVATGELKSYGYLLGQCSQNFVEPDKHPKHKLLNNNIFFAMLVGALVKMVVDASGKVTIKRPKANVGPGLGGDIGAGVHATAAGIFNTAYLLNKPLYVNAKENLLTKLNPLEVGTGVNAALAPLLTAINAAAIAGITMPLVDNDDIVIEGGLKNLFPGASNALIRSAAMLDTFSSSWTQGADDAIQIIRTLTPYRQYALQMQAHGFYDEFKPIDCSKRTRFIIDSALYLKKNSKQQLKKDADDITYVVNNLLRQRTVVINTRSTTSDTDGPDFIHDLASADADQSLITVGTSGVDVDIWKTLGSGQPFELNNIISSHYAAVKLRNRNQYGQVEGVDQVPVTECEEIIDTTLLDEVIVDCDGVDKIQKIITSSNIYFGGDVYINRYTEKNNMLFFNNWMYDLPDGTEYNYFLSQLVPQVRFWANTNEYDVGAFTEGFFPLTVSSIINFFSPTTAQNLTGSGSLPRSFYKLDTKKYSYNNGALGAFNPGNYPGLFATKESFFYLGVSSIRDFFVESEVMVDHRIAKELPHEKHYNPYGYNNLAELLNINPDWITRGNSYFYDYSLSISKLFTEYFSQGVSQNRFYNPRVASQCYTYLPDTIVYSLPQVQESVKDSWFTYLANNYKSFQDEISGVKNFAKTGIFVAFKNASPLVLQGVDELQTDGGIKITIGDGGLFARQPQNVTNADRPYEYGSCQNRLSIISTPAGMFYASQNQGKLFTYGEGIQEISNKGMKWWFSKFLPYQLLDDFPNYPHTDNPVAGIGVHSSYNSYNTVLYFSKRDFKLRPDFVGDMVYDERTETFTLTQGATEVRNIILGNPTFFEDASWTLSYDPKNQFWISFHDWHPNLYLPSRNVFFTTKEDSIYKHSQGCDGYCNFYGIDYPFEVELPIATGQQVNTIRSMEYILECYRRSELNCVDQFHVLDFNFDRAVVYNTEQTSGILDLIPYPKNNPFAAQTYPLIAAGPDRYQILFSKEENKYRFNQFWDITNDRGEFTPVEENIWFTQANGYIKELNPLNLDYDKSVLERKRFRHYINFLHLSREVSGDTNMLLKIVNTKQTYSPR